MDSRAQEIKQAVNDVLLAWFCASGVAYPFRGTTAANLSSEQIANAIVKADGGVLFPAGSAKELKGSIKKAVKKIAKIDMSDAWAQKHVAELIAGAVGEDLGGSA